VTAVSFLCPQGQSDGAKAPGVAKANALSFKQVREAEVESRGLGMDAEGLQKTIKGLLRSLPHMIAPVLFLSLLLESDLSLIKNCFLFSPVPPNLASASQICPLHGSGELGICVEASADKTPN